MFMIADSTGGCPGLQPREAPTSDSRGHGDDGFTVCSGPGEKTERGW